MARSRNIANYETAYWDILSAMRQNVPELIFKLDKKSAINIQQTFYAFIRAIEHSANIKNIGNEPKRARELKDDADTMRGYLTTIKHKETHSVLRFVNRDLNTNTQSFRDQIHEQLNNIHTQVNELEEIKIKPLDDFFATNLKVNDEQQT